MLPSNLTQHVAKRILQTSKSKGTRSVEAELSGPHYLHERSGLLLVAFVLVICFPTGVLAAKEWPASGLRGVTTKLIAKEHANTQNPGAFLSDQDFQRFAEWGVKLLRVEIEVDPDSGFSSTGYLDARTDLPEQMAIEPYRRHIDALRHTLSLAQKYNMYVLLIGTSVAGRKSGILYEDDGRRGYFQHLLRLWEYVARNFGSHPQLIAYDFLGEPHTDNEVREWHRTVFPSLVKAVRKHDRSTYIVVEVPPWASIDGYRKFVPIADRKAIYSFHIYSPHTYTHQGLKQRWGDRWPKQVYPGNLRQFDGSPEKRWDKDELRLHVEPVREFQQTYNVQVIVGEFGVVRWAPGGAQWISDVISIFEEYGWSWCYHSYGGWNGWNPTFSEDDVPSNNTFGGKETDRLKVLVQWWHKNGR